MAGLNSIALRYLLFAAIATVGNLGTQAIVLTLSRFFAIYAPLVPDIIWLSLAVASGTGIGLVIKYLLDKKYIFYFKSESVGDDIRRFSRYSLFGVLTTLIFWGCEFGLHAIWDWRGAKFVGGAIGLAQGYYIKYRLDKAYVFRAKTR